MTGNKKSKTAEASASRAGSMKQAAAMLGVSLEALRAAKNAGCPGFDDHHRVDLDAVRSWLERNKKEIPLCKTCKRPMISKDAAELRNVLLQGDGLEHK